MRLYSWNVNGLRAAATSGLPDWLARTQPDVLCLQETRCGPGDLPEDLRRPAGYHTSWVSANRKGYSGVATFSRLPPIAWRAGLGIERFDVEGRVLATDLGSVELYNVYFPNGRLGPDRLAYKLAFYAVFLEHVDARVAAGRAVLFCGDVNTAHWPVDLARPRENARTSGFLPEERAWLDRWREHGWVDTFRLCHPDAAGARLPCPLRVAVRDVLREARALLARQAPQPPFQQAALLLQCAHILVALRRVAAGRGHRVRLGVDRVAGHVVAVTAAHGSLLSPRAYARHLAGPVARGERRVNVGSPPVLVLLARRVVRLIGVHADVDEHLGDAAHLGPHPLDHAMRQLVRLLGRHRRVHRHV